MIDPLISIIDLETTGLPPDAAVCEVATCLITHELVDQTTGLRQWRAAPTIACLTNPCRFIPPEISAIHHIVDADVTDAPHADRVLRDLAAMDVDIWVAHHADFERSFFQPPGGRWICSWKCAMRQWPEAPSHSNQALRYWLGLAVDPDLAMPPHRAGPDAYVTAHLLLRLLQFMTPEQMLAVSAEPALLYRCNMQKYKGKLWADVPSDYMQWILRTNAQSGDFDENVVHTCRHWLEQRARHTERPAPPFDPKDAL